jgi:hypothetical protein
MQLNWNDLKGKFAKLLINPITGGNAQVNNPDTWNYNFWNRLPARLETEIGYSRGMI